MTFMLFIARQNDSEKGNGHFVTLIETGMHLMRCISGHYLHLQYLLFCCFTLCFNEG